MTDFLAGYVVPPGTGISPDPGLKASQRSTGGALSVFETTIGTWSAMSLGQAITSTTVIDQIRNELRRLGDHIRGAKIGSPPCGSESLGSSR
jgi:hypothetical protein